MRKPVNRFDVMVTFPDSAFGIKNRPDVVLTPEGVAKSLEEFCARIRSEIARAAAEETTNG